MGGRSGRWVGERYGLFYKRGCPENTSTSTAGDRLLLFTDGITEACGADGEEFGEENLAAFAMANCTGTAAELNGRVVGGSQNSVRGGSRMTRRCGGGGAVARLQEELRDFEIMLHGVTRRRLAPPPSPRDGGRAT
jgi:hypothetical protein